MFVLMFFIYRNGFKWSNNISVNRNPDGICHDIANQFFSKTRMFPFQFLEGQPVIFEEKNSRDWYPSLGVGHKSASTTGG
jgi:hypothetical protein